MADYAGDDQLAELQRLSETYEPETTVCLLPSACSIDEVMSACLELRRGS